MPLKDWIRSFFGSRKDSQEKERGVPVDRKEYESWLVEVFTQLPKGRGEDAFMKYLEDLGEGCQQSVNTYDFWLKYSALDLEEIYKTYVKDSDKQILGVTPQIISDFNKGASAMTELKNEVKKKLEDKFTAFQVHLRETYGERFKN